MFTLSDTNPSQNIVMDGGEGVGMDQWGLPRSCTQALPAGRVFRIGEGVNQFEEDRAGWGLGVVDWAKEVNESTDYFL